MAKHRTASSSGQRWADCPARLRGRDPGGTPDREVVGASVPNDAALVADLRVAGTGCCVGVVLGGQPVRGPDPGAGGADRHVAPGRRRLANCARRGEQGA
jgi:hypothetical protein